MTAADTFARAVVDARTTAPVILVEGVVALVMVDVAGQVTQVQVDFPAGRHDCRWTGAFQREALDALSPDFLVGARVLVAGGVVLGTIYPRGT